MSSYVTESSGNVSKASTVYVFDDRGESSKISKIYQFDSEGNPFLVFDETMPFIFENGIFNEDKLNGFDKGSVIENKYCLDVATEGEQAPNEDQSKKTVSFTVKSVTDPVSMVLGRSLKVQILGSLINSAVTTGNVVLTGHCIFTFKAHLKGEPKSYTVDIGGWINAGGDNPLSETYPIDKTLAISSDDGRYELSIELNGSVELTAAAAAANMKLSLDAIKIIQ